MIAEVRVDLDNKRHGGLRSKVKICVKIAQRERNRKSQKKFWGNLSRSMGAEVWMEDVSNSCGNSIVIKTASVREKEEKVAPDNLVMTVAVLLQQEEQQQQRKFFQENEEESPLCFGHQSLQTSYGYEVDLQEGLQNQQVSQMIHLQTDQRYTIQ